MLLGSIVGAVDLIAAVILILYLGNLGWWIWLIAAILVYQGFMKFFGVFR